MNNFAGKLVASKKKNYLRVEQPSGRAVVSSQRFSLRDDLWQRRSRRSILVRLPGFFRSHDYSSRGCDPSRRSSRERSLKTSFPLFQNEVTPGTTLIRMTTTRERAFRDYLLHRIYAYCRGLPMRGGGTVFPSARARSLTSAIGGRIISPSPRRGVFFSVCQL